MLGLLSPAKDQDAAFSSFVSEVKQEYMNTAEAFSWRWAGSTVSNPAARSGGSVTSARGEFTSLQSLVLCSALVR